MDKPTDSLARKLYNSLPAKELIRALRDKGKQVTRDHHDLLDIYCLRCKRFEWDESAGCCLNQYRPPCPMNVKELLASLELDCLVL